MLSIVIDSIGLLFIVLEWGHKKSSNDWIKIPDTNNNHVINVKKYAHSRTFIHTKIKIKFAERKRNWHEMPLSQCVKIQNKTSANEIISSHTQTDTNSRCARYNATVKTNKINRSTHEKSVNLLLLVLLLQLLSCFACLFAFSQSKSYWMGS